MVEGLVILLEEIKHDVLHDPGRCRV